MASDDKKLAKLPKEIEKYEKENGNIPFDQWRKRLDKMSMASVDKALKNVQEGKAVKVKSYGNIGAIVLGFPKKIRIYYGLNDDKTIVILGGGSDRQNNDIRAAEEYWDNYNQRGNEDA